jgi:hypothetical protein
MKRRLPCKSRSEHQIPSPSGRGWVREIGHGASVLYDRGRRLRHDRLEPTSISGSTSLIVMNSLPCKSRSEHLTSSPLGKGWVRETGHGASVLHDRGRRLRHEQLGLGDKPIAFALRGYVVYSGLGAFIHKILTLSRIYMQP